MCSQFLLNPSKSNTFTCQNQRIVQQNKPFLKFYLTLIFIIHSASGCPIANRNKLRALEMESVVEKQRHLNGGSSTASLLGPSHSTHHSTHNSNNNSANTLNGSSSLNASQTHGSYSSVMSSAHLPLTSLMPPSVVQTSLTTSSSALKIDGVNCPTIGTY